MFRGYVKLPGGKDKLRGTKIPSRERTHIPPNGKRQIIDSKLPFQRDMLVPRKKLTSFQISFFKFILITKIYHLATSLALFVAILW